MTNGTILVVDDEPRVRWPVVERLTQDGHQVVEASTGAAAINQLSEGVNVVLLDLMLPDADGLSILKRIQQADPHTLVILLTAVGNVKTIVEVMKQGAFHCVTKPCDLDELTLLVQDALDTTQPRREVQGVGSHLTDERGLDQLIGQTTEMTSVKVVLQKIAASPATTVLLTGESGTGKDLAAKAIHFASRRASKPFMNITCSALTETLLESELFGHERGAFTDAKQMRRGLLESGDGGTIFLDEVAEMSLPQQMKLLRFLEDRHFKRVGGTTDIRVDVRVIAATNRDLEQAVSQGAFREDLYYRLNVARVSLPPLRDRSADVPRLVSYYLKAFNRAFGSRVRSVSKDALRQLATRPWRGNVRELRNAVEHAMLMAEGDTLSLSDFPVPARDCVQESIRLPAAGVQLGQLERSLVVQALERTNGNRTQAGRLLGLSREQIRYRIEKFSIGDLPSLDAN